MPAYIALPDGARLAYEVFGSDDGRHLKPIVFVCGTGGVRNDWMKLATSLSKVRPVLLYDHRGAGDSTYASADRTDVITLESLARDLIFLISSLQWKEVALCGFSMGGAVVQQLVILLNRPSHATTQPFRVTHLFLTGTLASNRKGSSGELNGVLPGRRSTPEEKEQKLRVFLEATFDPQWLVDNAVRFKDLLNSYMTTSNRPVDTMLKQAKTLQGFDLTKSLSELPRDIQVLVSHGELDSIVPFKKGQEIVQLIPKARMVDVGPRPGQVPSRQFGHQWVEYFPITVWHDVFEDFLGGGQRQARL